MSNVENLDLAIDLDSGDRIIRLEIWGLKDCHFVKTFIDDEMKR